MQIPGEYSVRGGIVDIYAPDWTSPARVEWFDTDIESIRFFDIDSQRSNGKCSGLSVSGIPESESANTHHFLDFFPSGSIVVLVEPQEIESASRSLVSQHADPVALHNLDSIQQSFTRHATALVGRLIAESDIAHCRLPVTLVERFTGDIAVGTPGNRPDFQRTTIIVIGQHPIGNQSGA